MNKEEIRESFSRREGKTNDLKGMQFVELEILKEFDKICRKNNIEYWLTDGTLLGAVRHKGFIPWDDDIDVCIKKEDEEKLKECLEEELPYYLVFEKDYCNEYYYKIKDKYSRIGDNKYSDHNIWIDIFYMSEIKADKEVADLVNNKIKKKLMKKLRPKHKKWLIIRDKIRWGFLKLFGVKDAMEELEAIFKEWSQKETDSFIYMTGKLWWHTYKKEWIFPLKEIEFEGYKFLCPNNFHQYLTSYYGDYMKLPPIEKRVPPHSEEINIFNEIEDKKHLSWKKREEHIKNLLK